MGRPIPGVTVRVTERVDAFLAMSHPGVQKDVKQLLSLFDSALFGLALDGSPTRFVTASAAAQDARLDAAMAQAALVMRSGAPLRFSGPRQSLWLTSEGTLEWTAVAPDSIYRVQVLDSNFKLVFEAVTRDTRTAPTGLATGTRYVARVSTRDSAGRDTADTIQIAVASLELSQRLQEARPAATANTNERAAFDPAGPAQPGDDLTDRLTAGRVAHPESSIGVVFMGRISYHALRKASGRAIRRESFPPQLPRAAWRLPSRAPRRSAARWR